MDVSIINVLNAPFPPAIRGYSWFLAKDNRSFRGTAIYVHTKWAKLVTKVPDAEKEMDMEIIHLNQPSTFWEHTWTAALQWATQHSYK